MLSILPPEVSDLISQYIYGLEDLATLHALLLTNKFLFTMAVRLLYRNPTDCCAWPFKKTLYTSKKGLRSNYGSGRVWHRDCTRAKNKLARFILALSATAGQQQGPLATVDVNMQRLLQQLKIEPLPQPPTVDYLTLIQDMDLDDITTSWSPAAVAALDYVMSEGVDELDYENRMGSNHLQTALTWAVNRAGLKQRRYLRFPIWDIERYVEQMPSLNKLERVQAQMTYYSGYSFEREPQSEKWSRANCYKRLADFVRMFREHHGTEQLVQASLEPSIHGIRGARGKEELAYQSALASLLAVPKSLVVLDWNNWVRYTLDPVRRQDVSLDKTIRISTQGWCREGVRAVWTPPQEDILRQCRSLQELEFDVLDRHVFEWAAANQSSVPSTSSISRTNGSVWRSSVHDPWVPSLRSLKMTVTNPMLRKVLEEAVAVFGRTLEVLHVHGVVNLDHQTPLNLCSMRKDACQWYLPRLRQLRINICARPYHVDPASMLETCVELETLSLSDWSNAFNQAGAKTQPSWYLPKLRGLDLLGMPAEIFNPSTLALVPNLERLSITDTFDVQSEETDSGHAEAAVQAWRISRAPLWTWDWHLPNLRRLILRGQAAETFDPRMLNHCVKLEVLHLDLMHFQQTARPFITPKDLEPTMQLRELRLEGLWLVSEKTMKDLLWRVCVSSLENLQLNGCHLAPPYTMTGVPWSEELFQITKDHPTLLVVTFDWDLDEIRAAKLGLADVERMTSQRSRMLTWYYEQRQMAAAEAKDARERQFFRVWNFAGKAFMLNVEEETD